MAVVGIHILRTDADHRAGEGAPPAAGFDIVITEVVGGLNPAQGLPAAVRLVIKLRLCAVYAHLQRNFAVRQGDCLAAVGEILKIAPHDLQRAGVIRSSHVI